MSTKVVRNFYLFALPAVLFVAGAEIQLFDGFQHQAQSVQNPSATFQDKYAYSPQRLSSEASGRVDENEQSDGDDDGLDRCPSLEEMSFCERVMVTHS